MHLDFNSFSDEAVHVAGFGGKDLCVLKSDDMIMIETMFSYCYTTSPSGACCARSLARYFKSSLSLWTALVHSAN
jgi:hypothetical protein